MLDVRGVNSASIWRDSNDHRLVCKYVHIRMQRTSCFHCKSGTCADSLDTMTIGSAPHASSTARASACTSRKFSTTSGRPTLPDHASKRACALTSYTRPTTSTASSDSSGRICATQEAAAKRVEAFSSDSDHAGRNTDSSNAVRTST
jgi:hypothetical protein